MGLHPQAFLAVPARGDEHGQKLPILPSLRSLRRTREVCQGQGPIVVGISVWIGSRPSSAFFHPNFPVKSSIDPAQGEECHHRGLVTSGERLKLKQLMQDDSRSQAGVGRQGSHQLVFPLTSPSTCRLEPSRSERALRILEYGAKPQAGA